MTIEPTLRETLDELLPEDAVAGLADDLDHVFELAALATSSSRTDWRARIGAEDLPRIRISVPSTDPEIVLAIESAARRHGIELEPVAIEGGRLIESGELAGFSSALATVTKALTIRAGGRIELTNDELHAAELVKARTDGSDAELFVIEIVAGDPPERPELDEREVASIADVHETEAETMHGLGEFDGGEELVEVELER